MSKLPLFTFISSNDYNGAFIMGSFVAAFSASVATGFSLIHKGKMESCKNQKNLYCEINEDNVILTTINIFLKTMIIILFFSIILFVFFGFGGGLITNYYKPKNEIIYKGIFHLFILIIVYFLFHYVVGYFSTLNKKSLPPIFDVLKLTFYDLGILSNSPPVPRDRR